MTIYCSVRHNITVYSYLSDTYIPMKMKWCCPVFILENNISFYCLYVFLTRTILYDHAHVSKERSPLLYIDISFQAINRSFIHHNKTKLFNSKICRELACDCFWVRYRKVKFAITIYRIFVCGDKFDSGPL